VKEEPLKDIHLLPEPLWYKDAVIYELHIKAFHDSNGDGIGDFNGLTQKLDYLEGLGVTAIWLLPFYPSPLRDDGYDIADYYNVHPDYGTLRDFRVFLREAHKRGLRVITELVINHTSDQHQWFRKARYSKPDSPWRNFYVWSDTPEKYRDARIIFKDFETSNWSWDPIAHGYYWHRFYSHQPDLNFDNIRVQETIFKVMDYWLDMGVDGMRLDAIPYLFEREGTNCENLPETYAFLAKLRKHIDSKHLDKMLLAEANQWPEDAVAYFGGGEMCHMSFHFPLMPRMFMSIRMEDRFPIIDILDQTPEIPENCQWALFLRNHDELTLEMVTDEERDYMYRVYAQDRSARINLGIRRRLAPLLENNRRTIELMNVLLFSLPGTPVIYYGDEIGMGDNYYLGDRNGVRTPMQWSADRNGGFSLANPQKLFLPVIIDPDYHYEALNVETQERNQASLLWWMKRFIAMRRRFKAFGRGNIEFLFPDNPKVLAFTRMYEDEIMLIVVNLSRHSQHVDLDLSKYNGYTPEEIFSRNTFPAIKENLYGLTLGSYGYFWFLLTTVSERVDIREEGILPEITVTRKWQIIVEGKTKQKLEKSILPGYIKNCRWFGGKARKIQSVEVREIVPLNREDFQSLLLIISVEYAEGLPELYSLPVTVTDGEEDSNRIFSESPHAAIARVKLGTSETVLYDAVYSDDFRMVLISMLRKKAKFRATRGELSAYPGKEFIRFRRTNESPTVSGVLKADQSNTAILYDHDLFLKFYRHLDEGLNPDLEIGKFLTERIGFPNVPPFYGSIEHHRPKDDPIVIATLQGYMQNEGDAWSYTLDTMSRYIERALTQAGNIEPPKDTGLRYDIELETFHPEIQEILGGIYPERASILGLRVAELHNALASGRDYPEFTPEPFSLLYQRSLYQSLQSHTRRVFQLARRNMKILPEELRETTAGILSGEKEVYSRFRRIYAKKLDTKKIRIHGDLHLGQILYTGKDFIIIDFEGEPARSLSERRLKRSAIVDVAGMIRSFHYAAYSGLFHHLAAHPDDASILEPWIDLWYRSMASSFIKAYLKTSEEGGYNPSDMADFEILLEAFLLEKAIYELGYELNNRPDWVKIPLKGIGDLLRE
jgi:maltose alpha-D-glucosyltransferase / alpha-amylase